MGERMIKKAWEHSNYRKEDLIFGTPVNDIDLSVFHPSPAHVFKLWQIYLDNVDPLLKVTHTPTLQPRIIDATGDLTNVSPTLNTLLFAIYCISIISLSDEDCWAMFTTSKEDLLSRYQFGCQQALLQASFLRTDDTELLTALNLYMVSTDNLGEMLPLLNLTDLHETRHRCTLARLLHGHCCSHCTAHRHPR